uniref:HD domain-containing protein n=1 Tax=Desulfobacca acetoxidans TaxID=60893 RepID=A0A7V4LCB1_9BACT
MAADAPEIRSDLLEPGFLWGDGGLAPLRLVHLTPGRKLPFNLFTAASTGGEFVLSCSRGRTYHQQTPGCGWGYFAVAEIPEVLTLLLERLEDRLPPEESLVLTVDTLLVWVQHFFSRGEARTPGQVDIPRRLLAGCRQLLRPAGLSLREAQRLRRHDSGLFSHSVNVCLLSLVFGAALAETRDAPEDFSLGALLHDVGMMTLSQDPFGQSRALEEEFWEKIKEHPHRGVELLAPLPNLPAEILPMVEQHHEAHDGSGYPRGLAGEDIHPWARVLRLLDSYEAMTSLRPWRPPLGEGEVRRIMATAWKVQGTCHPDLLDRFLSCCRE